MLIAIIYLMLPVGAFAATFEYTFKNPFDGKPIKSESLLMRGPIVRGDYDRLVSEVKRDPERFIEAHGIIVSSNGGDVSEAIKIATFVRRTFVQVAVGEFTGPCVSACFLIVAAAADRQVGPDVLGVHRPYLSSEQLGALPPGQAQKVQEEILKESRVYLESLAVPTSLIDLMFSRASSEVYWLSWSDVRDVLGFRPPWYDEYLVARCGLDKAVEREYFRTTDDAAGKKMVKVWSCGRRSGAREAREFIMSLGKFGR